MTDSSRTLALPGRTMWSVGQAQSWALALVVALGPIAAAFAQTGTSTSISLQGLMGQRAVVLIDGKLRTLNPGESNSGVRLISVGNGEATVEVNGRRELLRLGESQAQVGPGTGAGGSGNRLVIAPDGGGHFLLQGSINGQAARFMVDTGASLVAMGAAEAQRLGIDFRKGEIGYVQTANGTAPAYRVRVRSLRLGDIEFSDTEVLVSPQSMPFILLGNNVLSRFQMTRDADRMVLERKY